MARIFSKINKRTTFTCFDTNIVNLLQYYYLKQNNLDVGFSKKNKFHLISNIKKIIHASSIYANSAEGSYYAISKRCAEDCIKEFSKLNNSPKIELNIIS